ncbi:hypothetical protein AA0120_g9495 [Alternaria tenuissima]|nr:hypothetical protein AA0120_g9495 [Alternaria tenuissima]
MKRKLMYPLRQSTLVKLREICDDLKENLGLALAALNIDASIIAHQQLDALTDASAVAMKSIGNIETRVSEISVGVGTLLSEQEDAMLAKMYAWLTPLTTVFWNKHRESLSTNVRQDNSAQELLKNSEFKVWLNQVGKTLWCTGMPGIGKTINIAYIIDFLLQLRRNSNIGVAFVYFSYKDCESQTPVNIMASILQQLITQKPDYIQDLKDMYTRHIRDNTRPLVGDISSLLQNVVYAFGKVFIVIDALDECSDTNDVRMILLTELRKLQGRASLLVMSRPIPGLEKGLEGAIRIRVEASTTDIRNYLQQRLDAAQSMQKHLQAEPKLRDHIISCITDKIKGMFLMARLYLDTLVHKTTRRKIKSTLETLPEGLDSVYEELMIRIKLQNPKDHAELAIKVLGWIFYVVKPLTVTQVQHALAIEAGDDYLDEDGIPDRDLLVSVCAGMVMINENSDTISLVHYTTQEYFQRRGKFRLDHMNRDIAMTCLTYLKFNAFDLHEDDVASLDAIETLVHEFPLLAYAAQHWGDHLRSNTDDEIVTLALELLEKDGRVHLLASVKDYADNLTRGTYFRLRRRVLGLSLAACFGLTAVATRMLCLGASMDSADSNGETALHRAVASGHGETSAVLLDHGASIDAQNTDGWTSLHLASAHSNDALVALLLQRNADVNKVDGYNATPLYRAAESGTERVVRQLLARRADVLTKNSYLQTALHRAADNGHIAVVEMLVKHGADLRAKDHYGYTAFYRAADQGHDEVARFLRDAMRKV